MHNHTLTRADLTEAVFKAVGLSRIESAQMVEDILEEVCCALARAGNSVKLSSFGTFGEAEIAAHGPQPEDRPRSADRAAARARVPAEPCAQSGDQRRDAGTPTGRGVSMAQAAA